MLFSCRNAPIAMLKVLLILATFVSITVLFYTTFAPDREVQPTSYSTTPPEAITLSAPWLRFFSAFSFTLPVLIVDGDLLRSIVLGASPEENLARKLLVAVDEKYRGVTVSEDDDKLSVVYYSKTRTERDYWLFEMGGNETRAMLPFDLYSSSHLFLPSDIRTFLDDWKFARFIECNVLLERNSTEKRTIPLSFMRNLAELRDFIKGRRARLTLAGGTLLGWFRECSLIPHTTDIDFFIRAEEYSPSIRADLDARQSPYKLFRIYGTPSDSYELSINVKRAQEVNIDLFFLYTTANESFVGGLAWYTRKKYKWSYPRITSLCTADLLGRLFYVPCNTKEVLDMEYGNWQKDSPSSDFVWYKSHRNVAENGFFTKEEMKQMRAFG
uniref:W02B3.4-like N-terminal domain-containing protein n=1 Tax=Pristionchus pacificus TaxID=54126 RepID=A0A8R1YTM9_PRIPA